MSTAYDEIKTRLQGSMVALVTPMHPDGTVDYKRPGRPHRLAD